MLRVGFGRVFRQQAVFRDVATQFRQSVDAVHQYAGKPAEVVQAKIVDFQLVTIDTQNRAHIAHRRHRHIADIQYAGIWAQAAHAFCHNCRRVGVVHDPRFLVSVTLDQVDKLHHR
ncbi:hypothetical protein D3C86_1941090 [compost metagenome]